MRKYKNLRVDLRSYFIENSLMESTPVATRFSVPGSLGYRLWDPLFEKLYLFSIRVFV
jgi:hypothetical protein